MSTNLAIAKLFNANHKTIEGYLSEMEKYGKPSLSKMRQGWHSTIEVLVSGEGVRFEVSSDFRHSTPADSLALCCDRLKAALEKIKKGDT